MARKSDFWHSVFFPASSSSSSSIGAGRGRDLCVMESISSVTSCGKLIMYYTSFVAEEQEPFLAPQERCLAFSFFPRKLTAHFSNTYTYVIRAYPRSTSEMASLAAARRPYTDCFPSILFESQSALLQPRRFMHSRRLDRKRERERVLLWTSLDVETEF